MAERMLPPTTRVAGGARPAPGAVASRPRWGPDSRREGARRPRHLKARRAGQRPDVLRAPRGQR
eukprot:2135083-Pyramimonas_sp.AAC.1